MNNENIIPNIPNETVDKIARIGREVRLTLGALVLLLSIVGILLGRDVSRIGQIDALAAKVDSVAAAAALPAPPSAARCVP